MVQRTAYFFVVPYFLAVRIDFHRYAFRKPVRHTELSADGEAAASVAEVVAVARTHCALGHGQIVYRVQQVGLAFAVVTPDAVHIGREAYFLHLYVAVVGYGDFFQCRHSITKVQNFHKKSGSLPGFHHKNRLVPQYVYAGIVPLYRQAGIAGIYIVAGRVSDRYPVEVAPGPFLRNQDVFTLGAAAARILLPSNGTVARVGREFYLHIRERFSAVLVQYGPADYELVREP